MSRLKIFLAERDPLQPLLDVCGGPVQIYQESVDFSDLFNSSLFESDIVLVPHDAKYWSADYYKYLRELPDSKLILYFNRSDRKRHLSLKNSISIQTTKSYRDKQQVILIPYNVSSLEWLPRRPYSNLPVISFVGYVPAITPRRFLNSFIESPRHPLQCNSSMIRSQGLSTIKNSDFGHLIIKRCHYGGAGSLISEPNEFRKEFIDSVKNSDYIFTPRGDANGSQRLYEAMSAGRLPIIPFSNTRFPKVLNSDYESLFIQISTLSKTLNLEVRKSWSSLDQIKYDKYQLSLRQLFIKHLNYQTYLKNIFEQDCISRIFKLCI